MCVYLERYILYTHTYIYVCVCVCVCTLCLVAQSCLILVTPRTVACQAPLTMGFSRQEYWSGLPLPSPGDLPYPGIKPRSPALQVKLYQLSYKGREAHNIYAINPVKAFEFYRGGRISFSITNALFSF